MTYLNSNALLELLVQVRLLSPAQQRFILENRDKQAQHLIRQFGGRRRDDTVKLPLGFPDLVDIILSLGMQTPGPKPEPLTEEMILKAVGRELGIPFTNLDPLKLDMEVVTKYISKTFAIRHLLLPLAVKDGVLQVASYADSHRYCIEEELKAPAVIQPEHLFGLMQYYTKDVTAQTDCSLLSLAKPEVLRLLDSYLIFRLNFLNSLSMQAWDASPGRNRLTTSDSSSSHSSVTAA